MLQRGCQHRFIAQIWNILASRPKFVFIPTFIFCSPICSNNCGVVFYIYLYAKMYFSFREMIFLVRPLKYANFHREYIPSCVTSRNVLYLRYFCQHNPLFYHLNLILCHYWSWQRHIFFWWIFLSDILFLCRKVALRQRQFWRWPIWQNLLSF